MKIDLHIHSATGSDGAMSLEEIFKEAVKRGIGFLSITDHDNIRHQQKVLSLAAAHKIAFITGVELNVTLPCRGKMISLDFLGYGFNYRERMLTYRLSLIRAHREERAWKILDNLNREFKKEGRPLFTATDLRQMQAGVDGILSRPHIADYLVKKGLVADRQEAFDEYLVKCDVPKYPLSLEEASALVRGAGGKLFLAHPNDPNGTSLAAVTKSLGEQASIIEELMLDSIDGIECWHSRADSLTSSHYRQLSNDNRLLKCGGSDCHQKPVIMGSVDVPESVAEGFRGLDWCTYRYS